ncbi:MAG: hypothetical protein ACFFCS_19705 [Candidatus Hodarchaeota archaeon]
MKSPKERLAWEAFFLLPIIVAVAFLGYPSTKNVLFTAILTIVFFVNIAIRFLTIRERGDWIFFVFGIAAGGGNDLMSMARNVYDYNSITLIPFLNGLLPLWNICFWGQVFLLFRKVFQVEWFKGEPFKKDGRFVKGWLSIKLIVDLCILVFLRAIIYLTYNLAPWIPTSFYGAAILARFAVFKPRKNELLIIVILPYAYLFEYLMVIFGLYTYMNAPFLGMPIWLLLWWVFLVPIVLKQIFDMLEFYLGKKKPS